VDQNRNNSARVRGAAKGCLFGFKKNIPAPSFAYSLQNVFSGGFLIPKVGKKKHAGTYIIFGKIEFQKWLVVNALISIFSAIVT
jgi:hypothetical protein